MIAPSPRVRRCVELASAAICSLMLSAAPTPPAPKAPAASKSTAAPIDLSSILTPIREKHDVPALAVAIITPDGMEGIGFSGLRKRGEGAAIQPSDRFHLGSCTKAMTATLAAIIVADGAIKLESTVDEVLGSTVPSVDESWKAVTLEELLRHCGGAPAGADPKAWAQAYACKGASRECRRAFVADMLSRPIAQPRGTTVYSNQGIALAGFMLESATNEEYETLVTERLFTPLGITSAGFGPALEASGHGADGKPSNIDNPSAITPAGRVHMTLEDWGKFISLHLRRDGGERLKLDRAAFDRLHSPLLGNGAVADTPRDGVAMGWMVAWRPWGGGRVLTHAGSNTLWFCVAWVAPEKSFAVIAAANQGGDSATKACDEACSLAIASLVARRSRPASP